MSSHLKTAVDGSVYSSCYQLLMKLSGGVELRWRSGYQILTAKNNHAVLSQTQVPKLKSFPVSVSLEWPLRTCDHKMKLDRGLIIITSLTCARKPRLYGNVSRFPDVEPPQTVIYDRDNPGRRPRGHPRNSWQGCVDRSCREWLRMGCVVGLRRASLKQRQWRSEATRPWSI